METLQIKNKVKTIFLDSESALRKFINKTIPDDSIVALGNSLNTNDIKIKEILHEKGIKVYISWQNSYTNRSLDTFEDIPKPDFFLVSAEGIVQDGEIVYQELNTIGGIPGYIPENIIVFTTSYDLKGTTRKPDLAQNEFIENSQFTVAIVTFLKTS
jgi:hypothetical protein